MNLSIDLKVNPYLHGVIKPKVDSNEIANGAPVDIVKSLFSNIFYRRTQIKRDKGR